MAILIDHQNVNWPAGDRTAVAPITPGANTYIGCRLARQTTATPQFWEAGVTLDFAIETSDDGGATWQLGVGGQAEGGIIPDRFGGEAAETVFGVDIGPSANRVRAHVIVSGGTLRSEITIETRP